ncbi:MAG: hypothetical protein ABH834_03925 [Candidatus Altiarchaeota archaeon]
MGTNLKPVDLKKAKLYSIKERKSKVSVGDFARPGGFASNLSCVPDILSGASIRRVASAIKAAKLKGKPVVWALGAHVIKCGLSPLLIDLMDDGFVSHVALNGGGCIHDTEVALFGQTSEDVCESIKDGCFGFVRETGEFINNAVSAGDESGLGFGESVARRILEENPKHLKYSLLGNCAQKNIPVTVHVAFGTDIIHAHPSFDPAAAGRATHLDFRLYSAMIGRLSGGGVYLNVGSAVILPEVFLKAVSLTRNLGGKLSDFTCVNMDFIRQYRAHENVLARPGGKPIEILGAHEHTIPLLYTFLKEGEK